MKTLFSILILIMLSGCSFTLPNWQVVGDEEINPIAEMVARRVGQAVAIKDPDKVGFLNEKISTILAADIDNSKPLIIAAIDYANDKYIGDPLLTQDIISLSKLFGVDLSKPVIDLDMGKVRVFKQALMAFQVGLNTEV